MKKIVGIFYPVEIDEQDQTKCATECPQLRDIVSIKHRNCALFQCDISASFQRCGGCLVGAIGPDILEKIEAAQKRKSSNGKEVSQESQG
jgi:hypothetical protein